MMGVLSCRMRILEIVTHLQPAPELFEDGTYFGLPAVVPV